MSDDQPNTTTWEGHIEWLATRGLTADEIEDEFDHLTGAWTWSFTRSGEMLDWSRLHGRRRILELIEQATGRAEITTAEVRTKEDELRAAGRDHGVGSIARALNTSEATVRRRLGRLK